MTAPRVSIVIPVLNTRPYLDECLGSVLGQTLRNIEVICVDNGSTDGSLERLREWGSGDRRVRVIVHRQGRLGDARNAGVSVACGDYIGYVDSDDFVEPAMFERLHALATKHDAEVAVCGIKSYFQNEGRCVEMNVAEASTPSCVRIWDRPTLLRNLTAWNKIYRRSFLTGQGLRFAEDTYYEDTDYVCRAYLLASRIGVVPEALYYYRKQRDNQISTLRDERVFEIFRVYRLLDDFAAGASDRSDIRRCLEEVKVLRLLFLFPFLAGKLRRRFFDQMKGVFQAADLSRPCALLSRTEQSNYRIIRDRRYWMALALLWGRARLGRLLRVGAIRRAYLSLR